MSKASTAIKKNNLSTVIKPKKQQQIQTNDQPNLASPTTTKTFPLTQSPTETNPPIQEQLHHSEHQPEQQQIKRILSRDCWREV